ncbi:hypothetical protein J4458_00135 [Candidatus Woesearchaeota archaeon]|nr:hypothetical protein [Candidatus Woesearchaeota archaeon]
MRRLLIRKKWKILKVLLTIILMAWATMAILNIHRFFKGTLEIYSLLLFLVVTNMTVSVYFDAITKKKKRKRKK